MTASSQCLIESPRVVAGFTYDHDWGQNDGDSYKASRELCRCKFAMVRWRTDNIEGYKYRLYSLCFWLERIKGAIYDYPSVSRKIMPHSLPIAVGLRFSVVGFVTALSCPIWYMPKKRQTEKDREEKAGTECFTDNNRETNENPPGLALA